MIKRVVEAAIIRTCRTVHKEANDTVQRTMTDFVLASGPKIVMAAIDHRNHSRLVKMTQKATHTLLQRFTRGISLEELQSTFTRHSIIDDVLAPLNKQVIHDLYWESWTESSYTKPELDTIAHFVQQAARFLSRGAKQGLPRDELFIEVAFNTPDLSMNMFQHALNLDFLNPPWVWTDVTVDAFPAVLYGEWWKPCVPTAVAAEEGEQLDEQKFADEWLK
jgi:hypothetical protein